MRRSRSIRLVLLGSTGLLALTACDQADPLARNDFFQDEQQCAKVNDADACRQALADARAAHQQTAPAFASREACEARFGAENCAETKQAPAPGQIQATPQEQQQVAPSGGSWFLPLMMGYMMGRTLGGPGLVPGSADAPRPQDQARGPAAAGGTAGSAYYARPVYRDVNNAVYSGREALGTTRVLPPPKAAPTSIARGGFGRTGTGTVSS